MSLEILFVMAVCSLEFMALATCCSSAAPARINALWCLLLRVQCLVFRQRWEISIGNLGFFDVV